MTHASPTNAVFTTTEAIAEPTGCAEQRRFSPTIRNNPAADTMMPLFQQNVGNIIKQHFTTNFTSSNKGGNF